MAYENNQEILQFINRGQNYLREQSTRLKDAIKAGDENEKKEARANFWQIFQFLNAISSPFISATWSETDIIRRIHHYNSKFGLASYPHIDYANKEITVVKQPVLEGGAQFATVAQLATETANRQAGDANLQGQIDTINTTLGNLDFSTELTNALSNYTPTVDLFLPANESILESITQQNLDDIALNNAHRLDGDIHVTAAQKTAWNAKVETTDPRLSDSRNPLSHTHATTDITGFDTAITNEINSQITALNLQDGVTPVFSTPVVNMLSPGEPAVATITGPTTALVLTLDIPTGDPGQDGAPFTVNARGDDNDRFNSLYDSEGTNFTFLAEDTGNLYYRSSSADATLTEGWELPISFLGNDGWAPLMGAYSPDAEHVYLEVIDWIGGTGDKPDFPEIANPPVPTRWLLSPAGLTVFEDQATNIIGPTGPNGNDGSAGLFIIDDLGDSATMATHDAEARGYTFLRTDLNPNVIYQKASDTSGDWAGPYNWQGIPGSTTDNVSAVLSRLNDPPGSPSDGDRHLVLVGTGAWLNQDDSIAEWNATFSQWEFTTYNPNQILLVETEQTLYALISGSWTSVSGTGGGGSSSFLGLTDVNPSQTTNGVLRWNGSSVISGTNLVHSGTRLTSGGEFLQIGENGEVGSGRTIIAAGSATDVNLTLQSKGSGGEVLISPNGTIVGRFNGSGAATIGQIILSNGDISLGDPSASTGTQRGILPEGTETNISLLLRGKGTGTINIQSDFNFNSTTIQGVVVNNLTTTERDALTPANGAIIYNTTTSQFELRQNGAWVTLGGTSNTFLGLTDVNATQEANAVLFWDGDSAESNTDMTFHPGANSALRVGTGTSNSLPKYSFVDDIDTGIGNAGANIISIITGGTERLRIQNTLIDATVPVRTANIRGFYLNDITSSETVPTYTFTNDTNSGIGQRTSNELSLIADGNERLRVSNVADNQITAYGALRFSTTAEAGLVVNSLTTTERDALTPANGAIIYNETTNQFQLRENGAWINVGAGGGSTTFIGLTDVNDTQQTNGILHWTSTEVLSNQLFTYDATNGSMLLSHATQGPTVDYYLNIAAPVNGLTTGSLLFSSQNNNSEKIQYARIDSIIDDVTDGGEDGKLSFKVMSAGTPDEEGMEIRGMDDTVDVKYILNASQGLRFTGGTIRLPSNPSSPGAGDLRFNSGIVQVYNGSWASVTTNLNDVLSKGGTLTANRTINLGNFDLTITQTGGEFLYSGNMGSTSAPLNTVNSTTVNTRFLGIRNSGFSAVPYAIRLDSVFNGIPDDDTIGNQLNPADAPAVWAENASLQINEITNTNDILGQPELYQIASFRSSAGVPTEIQNRDLLGVYNFQTQKLLLTRTGDLVFGNGSQGTTILPATPTSTTSGAVRVANGKLEIHNGTSWEIYATTVQAETFNQTLVFDRDKNFDDFTQTGVVNLTVDDVNSSSSQDFEQKLRITTNGSGFTFEAGKFQLSSASHFSFQNIVDTPGDYMVIFYWNSDESIALVSIFQTNVITDTV